MTGLLLEFQNSIPLYDYEKANGKKKEITEESRQEGGCEARHRFQLPQV